MNMCLSGLPTTIIYHPDEHGVVGESFTLFCNNSANEFVSWWRRSNPDAEIDFISLRDGILLNEFQERCRLEGDHLVFHKLELNDTATYICLEEAGQGVRHVTKLNVSGNQRPVSQWQLIHC